MHQSVLDFGRAHLNAANVTNKRVIDIGALDVNGSLRPQVFSLNPMFYLGVDLQSGPGVNLVLDLCDPDSAADWSSTFDLAICTEMLEHARDWRQAVRNIKRMLAPNGMLILTTRSIGFARHHEHPGDYWRFSVEDMRRIFSDFHIEGLQQDPGGSGGGPGVFIKAVKPVDFSERDLESIAVYSMENEPA